MNELTTKIQQLLKDGLTKSEISRRLNIDKSTVRYHASEERRQYVLQKGYERKRIKRKDRMQILREEAGGKCIHCGYDRCSAALHFHHRDPSQKEFHVSQFTGHYSMERLRKETAKCDLICNRCHAEKTHPKQCKY